MINESAVRHLETEFQESFLRLAALQEDIHRRLTEFADGKVLKGNEIVGWLGEIYGKLLFSGVLVDDREEHDFETSLGLRVSVKTRKGWKSGWKQSSAIPKIDGDGCPTHLLFAHLNDDYSVDRMWLFEWNVLFATGRFKPHVVRGVRRSFVFAVDELRDEKNVIYQGCR